MSSSIPDNPSDGLQLQQERRRTWLQRPWRVCTLILALVFGPVVLFAIWEAGSRDKSKDEGGSHTSEEGLGSQAHAKALEPESLPANSPARERLSYEELDRTAEISQLNLLSTRIAAGQSLCDQLERDARKWQDAPDSLLTPEEKRKLAADINLVRELVAVLDCERPSLADVKALDQRLEAFRLAVESLRMYRWEFDDTLDRTLTNLLAEIQSSQLQFVQGSMDIDRLKDRASVLNAETASLDEAIEAVRIEAAKSVLASIVKDTDEDEKDAEARLVAEVEAKVLDEEQARFENVHRELASLQSESRRLQDDADATARSRQQELDTMKLKNRYDLEWPRMQKYLVPLTSDGYTQIIDRHFQKISVEAPVSYRRMLNASLLNDGTESLSAFYGTIASGGNDRDLGAFPPDIPGEGRFHSDFELLLTIQTFVREFGPLMVDKGDLAP